MAEFEVHRLEGTQYVDAHVDNESIRAEAGAPSYYNGDIEIESQLIPSPVKMMRSVLADEAIFRPIFSGTGVVTLESSRGGFHVLDLEADSWILEPGTYWASEDSIDLGFHRESLMTAIWANEGLVYLQTRVSGTGKVVVTTRGPVNLVKLEEGQRVATEGKFVICRSHDVSYRIRRATKNWLGRFTSGEGLVRVYEGPGKVLLNPAPYWRYRIFSEHGTDPEYPSRAMA